MKQWKKLLATVLVVAMVLPGITLVAPQVEEVQAADVTATGKEVTEQNGTLFAGYYVDDTYEIPSNVEGGVEKWVDSGVLNVKMQLREDSVDGTYDLRLVSSVDTLNYKNVGYRISFDADGDKKFAKEEVTTWTSKEVAKRIDATTSTFAYNYSPKVIDTKSEYFITGIMEGIKEEHKEKDFLIEPFWTTMDGTKVFGQSRWFSISDMLLGKTNINLPVQMTESEYKAVGSSMNVGATAATVSERYYDGRYAHFNLSVTDKTALPSASVVQVGDEKVIYRNLESKGTTGDTTWYEKYVELNAGETEFVIATSADLYGLEAVQNIEGNEGMTGKKVYMVADIALNDVTGITDWSTFGPSVAASKGFASWTPIGRLSGGFAGTFDGQMHTISGLYTNPGTFGIGLFGCIKTGSVIKNLYLKDSWMQGTNRIGGIVGISDGGTIDTVYNGAYVISTTGLGVGELTYQGVGGIVGLVRNGATDIKNCWNAGTVFSNHTQWAFAGGIVGNSNNAVTINNCLNSGTVKTSASVQNSYHGGLVGGTYNANANYNIKYCLSAGEIVNNNPSNVCIGSFCGKADNGGKATVSHSYATTIALGTSTEASLYGSSGWATTLLNDDYWVAVEEGVPELKSFRGMSDKKVSDVSSVTRTDTSWYDSNPTAEEYTLYTEEEFNGLIEITGKVRSVNGTTERQNFTNRTIKLGADLVFNEGDAKEWKNNAPGRNSKSVGAVSGVTYDSNGIYGYFDGIFDGQKYTISGLYMNRGTENYAGLFGIIGDNAVIKDFKFLNSYITGNGQSGTIVGRSNGGTISSVYSDAIFASADVRTGGIVGSCWANETDLTNCCFAGEMILTSSGQPLAGGIVGENVNTTVIVDGCWFDGKITSTSSAYAQKLGGIFGWTDGISEAAVKTEIKNCLSTGRITSNSPNHGHEGSVAGLIKGNVTTISDCYGSDTTQAYTYWTSSEGITAGTLPEAQLTGAAGMVYTTLSDTAWVGVKGGTPQLRSFQTKVTADYDVATDRVDTSWYTSDESGETYMLENAGDYFGFVQLSRNNKDFEGQKILLNADLDLKDIWCQSISPINSPFKGTFEGNNNTIRGLHIVSDEQHLGMFGYVGAMGMVQNVTLEDSYIESNCETSEQVVASIAGRLAGKLTNVDSSADVVCNQKWAGGLVAQTYHDSINYPSEQYPNATPALSQCSYTGTLTMTNSVNEIAGGIVGQVQGTTNIDNCLFEGVIDSYDVLQKEKTGGIVGYVTNTLTLSDCLSSGKIQFSKSEEITAAGSVIGYVTGNNANNYVTLSGVVYATADCFQSADGDILFWPSDTNTITGADTYMKEFTSTLNSTIGELNTTYWQTVEGGTPVLK